MSAETQSMPVPLKTDELLPSHEEEEEEVMTGDNGIRHDQHNQSSSDTAGTSTNKRASSNNSVSMNSNNARRSPRSPHGSRNKVGVPKATSVGGGGNSVCSSNSKSKTTRRQTHTNTTSTTTTTPTKKTKETVSASVIKHTESDLIATTKNNDTEDDVCPPPLEDFVTRSPTSSSNTGGSARRTPKSGRRRTVPVPLATNNDGNDNIPAPPLLADFQRSTSTDSATIRRLSARRRSSLGAPDNGHNNIAKEKSHVEQRLLKCPATVSTLSKPSLMAKMRNEDEKKLKQLPAFGLPMGEFICTSTGKSSRPNEPSTRINRDRDGKNEGGEESLEQVNDKADPVDRDDASLQEKLTDSCGFLKVDDDIADPALTEGQDVDAFFKFDPSKEDNFKPTITARADPFGMNTTKRSANLVVEHDSPNKHKKHANKPPPDPEEHTSCSTVASDENDNGKEDEHGPEGSEATSSPQAAKQQLSLFGANWPTAGFTLQSDNACGHFEDEPLYEDPNNNHSDEEEPEYYSEEEPEYYSEEEEEEAEEPPEPLEQEASESESEYSSEEEARRPSATQPLLQFNCHTPDGLDYAACQDNDNTSIFRMDSDRTLEVPKIQTTELSEFDKQLLGIKSKDKRNSLFSAKVLKAKSFKRPKSNLTTTSISKKGGKAESFRVPGLGGKHKTHASNDTSDKVGCRDRPGCDDRSLPTEETELDNDDDYEEDYDNNNNRCRDGAGADSKVPQLRRRDRVKNRREGHRDKTSDADEERLERLRKRDALRKAASARMLPNRTSSDVSPKRPNHIGHGRRRGTTGMTADHHAHKADFDQIGWERRQPKASAPAQDSQMAVDNFRKRSTMRKAQSVRNVGVTRTASGSGPTKKPLRRCASGEDKYANTVRHLTGSSIRKRHSEVRPSGRSREPDHDGISRSDKRHPRRSRRSSSDVGDEEMDRSRESYDGSRQTRRSRRSDVGDEEMDRSKESYDGSRQTRRSRRSREGEEEMDRSRESADGNRERRRGEKRHSRRVRRNRDKEEGEASPDRNSDDYENSQGIRAHREDEDPGSPFGSSGRRKVQGSSSMRVERTTFDNSFPDLTDITTNLSGTFHNHLGDAESDRRKSFMKSMSVRIGSKPIGKGARNLIVGGTRTEKRRLLDADDDSVT